MIINDIKIVKVNRCNYKTAIKIQADIFPNEKSADDIMSSVTHKSDIFNLLEYFLIKVDGTFVGICGLYSYKIHAGDAFLGWFGVLEQYRKNGYGTFALLKMMDYAKQKGFNNFRLYTDDVNSFEACKIYDKYFDIKEVYKLEETGFFKEGNIMVYSKSLTDKKVDNWNNRNLFLAQHEKNNKQ